jgi:hypothetical protein
MVIDASLTMTWYFDDESTAATDELLDRVSDTGAVLPACGIWTSRTPFRWRSGASASMPSTVTHPRAIWRLCR